MKKDEMKRLFVSMPIDGGALEGATSYIRREYGLRTADPSAAHVTLLFIGDFPSKRVPALGDALAERFREVPAFPYELRGVGRFPAKGGPRVLWAGIRGEGFRALHRAASEAVGSAPGDFVPHVTLCRVRKPLDPSGFLTEFDGASFGEGTCDSVQLMESILGRNGARHVLVRKFQL
ncbi:MAG: RNA 2',3'-cyclic phosphodiesterase [Thermoplasmatales archaeon]|nr:RNA 2',3'-cyclic phosphodiesterase [Thermoplasmatales archaeon]